MIRLIWLLLLACVGTYLCGSVDDPDLWWHIAVGKWIVAHGDVPRVDYWNTFGANAPWVAYSWSNEQFLALIDSAFGIKGLLFAQLFLALLFVAVLFLTLGHIAKDRFFGAVVGTFAAAACLFNFGLRPQTLAWVLFLLVLLIAQRIKTQGLTGSRLFCLFLLMIIWGNSHITTVLGLAALYVWLFEIENPKTTVRLAVVAILSAAAGTFITPYAGAEWLTFFGKTSHAIDLTVVKEFQPATLHQVTTGVVLLLTLLLGVMLHAKPRALSSLKLFGGAIFLFGGLFTVKFLPFAALFISALLAVLWSERGTRDDTFGNIGVGILEGRKQFYHAPQWFYVLIVTLLLIGTAHNSYKSWSRPLNTARLPVEAVTFIQKNDLPFPLLNIFGHGGYLIYRYTDALGNPLRTFPIDGRTNVNRKDIMGSYIKALEGNRRWHEYLDKVKPETILWRNESSLVSILLENEAWCAIYMEDDDRTGNSIFVKREFFEAERPRFNSPDCQ